MHHRPGLQPEAFEILTTRPTWKKSVRLLRTGPLTATPAGGARLPPRRRRPAGAGPRRARRDDFAEAKVVTKRPPTRRGAGRPAVRLAGVQARQEQRDRAGEGRHGGRRRRRADEPGRFGRTWPCARPASGRGARCWRPTPSSRSATTSTRRPQAGVTAIVQPGGSMRDAGLDRRLRRARPGDGLHRRAALPALDVVSRPGPERRRQGQLGPSLASPGGSRGPRGVAQRQCENFSSRFSRSSGADQSSPREFRESLEALEGLGRPRTGRGVRHDDRGEGHRPHRASLSPCPAGPRA